MIYSVPPPYSRTEFVPVSTHCAPSIHAISFSLFFLLGPCLSHGELPAYLHYILTHGTPFEHLSGYLLLPLLVRLQACCLWPALLSFSFFRCLLPVGCRFLTGFSLASYRGVGVGCEAPHLRSISPNFPGGFCALLIFYASESTGLQGGLVS